MIKCVAMTITLIYNEINEILIDSLPDDKLYSYMHTHKKLVIEIHVVSQQLTSRQM